MKPNINVSSPWTSFGVTAVYAHKSTISNSSIELKRHMTPAITLVATSHHVLPQFSCHNSSRTTNRDEELWVYETPRWAMLLNLGVINSSQTGCISSQVGGGSVSGSVGSGSPFGEQTS
jgi:hypothetical protein